ncbi:MAG: hypothetical protein H7125_15600 [Proteobacteria bacterium]|nr:hypothetical protein [Burkholderiales bacterium]
MRNGLASMMVCAILAAPLASAQVPQGYYLDCKSSKVGVILAHGQGLEADSQVVSPLRKAIHRELGYHTLSLQMPVLQGNGSPDTFQQYASTFPEAYTRIQNGINS